MHYLKRVFISFKTFFLIAFIRSCNIQNVFIFTHQSDNLYTSFIAESCVSLNIATAIRVVKQESLRESLLLIFTIICLYVICTKISEGQWLRSWFIATLWGLVKNYPTVRDKTWKSRVRGSRKWPQFIILSDIYNKSQVGVITALSQTISN